MSQKISVLIPVYRESSLLEPLLQRLIKDPYTMKDVVCVIDKPSEKSLELVEKLKDKVKFILNGHRLGKANALNEAFKHSEGDILLFLDSDVQIPENINGNSFLKTIVEEISDFDLLDIKKKSIRDSFIAKITHYDYLCNTIANWIFFKTLKKCLGFNGAAFAIKRQSFERLGGFRRVVSEDLDLGTRSFLENLRFKQSEKVEVYTKVPSNLKAWYRQRKRWGTGTALWIKEYYKLLAKVTVKFPKTLIPSIFILSPFLPIFIVNFFFPSISSESLAVLFLTFLTSKLGFLIPTTFLIFLIVLMKNLTLLLGSYVAGTILYYLLARKLNYMFNPAEFFLFYFLLSPLWLLIVVTSIIRVLTQSNKKLEIDWVY
ncbi:MAG: glycosyltransferase [Candidatus Bathyarchaeota archaeon]